MRAFKKSQELKSVAEEARKLSVMVVENSIPRNAVKLLTPQYVAQIRSKAAQIVFDHINVAEKVLLGELQWNANQVQVFKALLNKVVPDISAQYHAHEVSSANPEEMSREELERLASIEAEYTTETEPSK